MFLKPSTEQLLLKLLSLQLGRTKFIPMIVLDLSNTKSGYYFYKAGVFRHCVV